MIDAVLMALGSVRLVELQDYLPFFWLMDHSDLILTDSSYVQVEGPQLGMPILIMRDVTERPGGLEEVGTVRLVGTDIQAIAENVERVLQDTAAYAAMSQAFNPYGDRHAVQRIVEALRIKLEQNVTGNINDG